MLRFGLHRLSLQARLAMALECVWRYCQSYRFQDPELKALLDHLWDFMVIDSPGAFVAWEEALKDVDDPSFAEFGQRARAHGIDPAEMMSLLDHTLEIIRGSFYAATDDRGSLRELRLVLAIGKKRGAVPAGLPVYRSSRFADRHGWGFPLARAERDRWRSVAERGDG